MKNKFITLMAVLLALLLLTPSAALPALGATAVFINEIHYDNASTDDGEAVEIAGPAGTDLSGWSLELYNGSNGTVYHTFSLGGVIPNLGGGFGVIAINAAGLQNGGPDGLALVDAGNNVVQFLSYEGSFTAASGPANGQVSTDIGVSESSATLAGQSLQLTGTGAIAEDFSWAAASASTFGASNNGQTFVGGSSVPPPEACGDPVTPIYEVQGSGAASPLVGTEVAVEGIVVGDFQTGGLSGFHVQESAATADGDPATSDGVFVFASGGMDVNLGDAVRVRGTVSEFHGLTEIGNVVNIWLCSTGNSVAPTPLSLPVASVDDLEAFEGMLVTFPQSLTISEYFNFDRFGEIVLTTNRRLTPTAVVEPGPDAVAAAQDYLLNRITLDDGRTWQNPDPALHPNGSIFDLSNRFRGGDTVQNVTGALHYSFGLYRIQPTTGGVYSANNPRPAQPDSVGGGVSVASFNVLNYFTTLDDSGPICGPLQDQGCRGADNADEFARQRAKIIAAISAINADVVGLIELENHPADAALLDLVAGLNDAMGAGTYAAVATGPVGSDVIRVGFIYKPAAVTPLGGQAVLDASVDPRFNDDKNRPALAQSFMDNDTGGVFTAVVNHFKSKGSSCNSLGDPNVGDGSGNCNLTRLAAAEALVDWLATDPTGSGDSDVLIIGDLNSYDKEAPIDAILAGADDTPGSGDDYNDLLFQLLGEGAYSYVFDGQVGYLDYALANQALRGEVTGATVWHINADEPDILDYDTSFKKAAQDALFEPNAYRSSDHDPVIVGLDVCDEIAPTIDVTVSPDELWLPNKKLVEVHVTVNAADNFDPNPTVSLLSVESNQPPDEDEPDEDDVDGDDEDDVDIQIVDTFTVKLRVEQGEDHTDRVYTLTYQVTDACGNSAVAGATVTVPHDRDDDHEDEDKDKDKEKDKDRDKGDSHESADEVGNSDVNPNDQTGPADEDTVDAPDETEGDESADVTDGETAPNDAGEDPAAAPDESTEESAAE